MITARWIVAGLLGAIFLYMALANLYLLLRPIIRGGKRESWVPILGGLSGMIACFVAPSTTVRAIWWIPLVLDFGTLP